MMHADSHPPPRIFTRAVALTFRAATLALDAVALAFGRAALALGAALLALGLAICAGARAAQPTGFVIRDDLQRDVAFSRSPQRIITMLPSITETVCALGACDRLVATDRFSNWPAQVKTLPKAGGLDDAAVELIVSLRPDLVFLSRSQRITDRLHELGIATFVLSTQTYADIGRTVKLIGEILGLPDRAALLGQDIDNTVHEIGSQAVARRHGAVPSVYYEVDRAPYAAGPDSFIGELLALLGARNIVTADLGPFPKLNPEYVVRHDPDVIFVSPEEAANLAERPGWDHIRAVREKRLCTFAPEVRDTIIRPGPRVSDGMQALAGCLQRMAP
jgi:iron complex transport system substrate-binding protein